MGSTSPRRAVCIASASGAVTDLVENLADIAQNDDVDFIVGDWMSEYNMAIRGISKASNHTAPCFEQTFIESIAPALENLSRKRIKVAVNAGASDTQRLHQALTDLISKRGVDLQVAWVEGDEVLEAVRQAQSSGDPLRNITTGQSLSDWEFEPVYAQCYLGCWGIVEAFRGGADIVVCGRVADAAPTMAAAAYWYNWSRDSYSELAHSLIAGHMIECSFYVTGGNYTGFKTLPQGANPLLCLPIATIQKDGTFFVGRQHRPDRSGEVSVNTCRSQLLYELQGKNYYNSDVVAVIDQIKMEKAGPDSVYIHNIGFEKPPPTTKVGITALGGYQAEAHYMLCGLDVMEKAKILEQQLRHYLNTERFTKLQFSTAGAAAINPENQDAATIDFRIFVQARDEVTLAPENFIRPVINLIMSTYPGATFALDMRQGIAKPYNEYFVTILPLSVVKHVAHLPFASKSIPIEPPKDVIPYRYEQESNETVDPVDLSSFGPTTSAPLGYIVHARSGDKASDANVGFYVRYADEWDWLRSLLTVDTMKCLLRSEYNGKRIERFELPNIHAVHFLLKDHLDRGVGATSTFDVLGKNLAEYLRAQYIEIPKRFLARAKI